MSSRSVGLTLLEGADCQMEGIPGSDGLDEYRWKPDFRGPNPKKCDLKWFSLAAYMLSWKEGSHHLMCNPSHR